MKYFLAFFLTVNSVMYASSMDIKPLRIDVALSGLPDGTVFYLLRQGVGGDIDTLGTAKSRGGEAQLVTDRVTNGELVFVNFGSLPADKTKTTIPAIRLFIDNPSVHIKGDIKKWPIVDIEGSKATKVFDRYHESKAPVLKKVNDALKEMARQKTSDSSVVKPLLAEYRLFALDYFRKNLDVLSTPYMVSLSFPLTYEDKKQLWLDMNTETKESFFGKELARRLKFDTRMIAEWKAAVGIDKVLPGIKLRDEDGSVVSLKELASRNEYTLIDFWAYWCAPCRAAMPEIKVVYERYRKKGFNVVTVSTDPDRAKWGKALKELDTKWINVIDEDKVSQKIFSIKAIPAYILVNKKSEIIAMDIVGQKNNGASVRYFPESDKVRLSGKTIGPLMAQLIEK